MIIKMIILRLLGSSDDKKKEKIGVARPEGLPLRGFRIHLLGDSNTKCTLLGGVHPIGCDFETNMFPSLSFVVSRGVNTLRECYS